MLVVDLGEPAAIDVGRCGAEGSALARARQAGLRVPDGGIVTTGADVVAALDGLRRLWERLGRGATATVRIGSLRIDGITRWERLLEAVGEVRRAADDERAPVLVHRDVRAVTGGIIRRDGRVEAAPGDPVALAEGLTAGREVRLGPRAGRGGPLRPLQRLRLARLRRRAPRSLGRADLLWAFDPRGRLWVVGAR